MLEAGTECKTIMVCVQGQREVRSSKCCVLLPLILSCFHPVTLYKTNRFHFAVPLSSVIDHKRRQNVVSTSVTHSPSGSWASFLCLPHFDVICDL